MGYINIEQNKIMKFFLSCFCDVPSCNISCIHLYGMNFDFMPELHFKYGYPMAID